MSSQRQHAAEAFPPGLTIQEELEVREWTQADLAAVMGVAQRKVSELIRGKAIINAELARKLSGAFGTSPEFWLNLENSYQLFRCQVEDQDIALRARIYNRAPVAELTRRGWIEGGEDMQALERQVLAFYATDTLDQRSELKGVAARAKISLDGVSTAQEAWMRRAIQLGTALDSKKLTPARLRKALEALREIRDDLAAIRHIPRVLADAGVRFVTIERTNKSLIDGATLWLQRDVPIVAMSLRIDRLDYFWFTLMHELGHVFMEHGSSMDEDLLGSTDDGSLPQHEKDANQFAAEFLVPPGELRDFVSRVHPMYSTAQIKALSRRLKVHPSLVVGQLKHQGKLPWSHFHALNCSYRELLVDDSLCDGWGRKVIL